jgi:hypothetical protein
VMSSLIRCFLLTWTCDMTSSPIWCFLLTWTCDMTSSPIWCFLLTWTCDMTSSPIWSFEGVLLIFMSVWLKSSPSPNKHRVAGLEIT